ncbi:host attachment family protein [Sphingomonas morindae]|uniref:host attachment family protein n=1 Tax=Sphingomonas morindae TaxID=1541170 RepID=UPI00349E901D
MLVVDGRKSLFFQNQGDADQLNLQLVSGQEHADLPDREQKRDAQGRKTSSTGIGGDDTSETDFHQQEEDRFAADTAEELRRRALSGEFEQLIVVAAPKTLGELRKHYHKEVETRLLGELAKDLTGHSVPDIEKILLSN